MILLWIVLLALFTLHFATRYSRAGRLIEKIPGPAALPIIGNLLLLNVRPERLFYVMRDLAKWPIVRCWFGPTVVMVGLRDPADLEILLSSQRAIQKSFVYGYIEPWLNTGLLTSTGDKWRTRRKILTPAFHFQILRKYLDIAGEQTDKYINKLSQEGSETVQELEHVTSTVTLNIVSESAMGVTLDKLDTEKVREYTEAIHNFGSVVAQRSVKPYIMNWMMCPLIELGRLQISALKVLHEFTDKVVKERRKYHEVTENRYLKEVDQDHDDGETLVDIKTKKRLAMLDHLLLSEKKGLIDEKGIKEEVDTFTFEGHDTTGMGLFFTLMLLAENKEIQDKARAEVIKAVGKSGGDFNVFDNQEFAYVERCIKEALRLYPSVPNIIRHLTEDIKLKNYLIPAGTDVLCFLYDLHRDPKLWPEPEKYDPDRFLPENCQGRHPFSYLPFSAGPRNCIGQKFAMLLLKTIVSRILYNYYLEPIDRLRDIRFTADMILRPTNPVNLKFIKIRS